MTEKLYHPILTAKREPSEEFEKELENYLHASYKGEPVYTLITEDDKVHVLAPFHYWIVFDGEIPKGQFLGAVKIIDEKGIRYKTRVLDGQLNKAYDYKTGKRVKFTDSYVLTHYMPKPIPPLVQD
jgi:hypothetical protein